MMASLAASLMLLTLCFHLPLDVPPTRIGWGLDSYSKEPLLDVVDINPASTGEDTGVLITTGSTREAAMVAGTDRDGGDEAQEVAALPAPAEPERLRKLTMRPVLEFAEQMPEIVGGMGAYYIHIEYPPAAIAAGIEGRLVLDFVVEPDGLPTGIEVLQSLHPLCGATARPG
jgi:protein TonB